MPTSKLQAELGSKNHAVRYLLEGRDSIAKKLEVVWLSPPEKTVRISVDDLNSTELRHLDNLLDNIICRLNSDCVKISNKLTAVEVLLSEDD